MKFDYKIDHIYKQVLGNRVASIESSDFEPYVEIYLRWEYEKREMLWGRSKGVENEVICLDKIG